MRINKVLKALSHPTRRDILVRLRNGRLSAGELASHFDVSKPTMSAHFSALKAADLVYTQRDGNTLLYHLNVTVADEALASLMSIIGSGNSNV